jgi:FkbM family methyltransferase
MKKYFQKLKYFLLSKDIKYHQKLINVLTSEKLSKALLHLESKGVLLDVIYDIGARHAEWSTCLKPSFKNSAFYLFEANEKCTPELEKSGFKFFISTLSSKAGIVEFFTNDSTGDSYYKENTSFYKEIASVKKASTTLDGLIAEKNIPFPHFIKIDTQGSELDILMGASSCIKHASLIYLECPLFNYNQGAPDFSTYLNFMSSQKFYPYEICEHHYSDGILIQIDVLFVKLTTLNTLKEKNISHLQFNQD